MTDAARPDIAALAERIAGLSTGDTRVIVAIAGPPASGKSTLAETLSATLGARAEVLPMDGFHLDNAQLQQMGLLHRKGAPETFDAEGFVALVKKLRTDAMVPYPTFNREADKTVPYGGEITSDTKIVLIEGNYLLLDTPPWSQLKDLFDLTIGLNVPREELVARLIARWVTHGLSPEDARTRALENDMRNADFVAANARDADIILTFPSGSG